MICLLFFLRIRKSPSRENSKRIITLFSVLTQIWSVESGKIFETPSFEYSSILYITPSSSALMQELVMQGQQKFPSLVLMSYFSVLVNMTI